MKTLIRYAAAAALMLFVPFAANAAEGYVTDDLTLYGGPDTDYPEIAYIPAGTFVTIWGCVDGYEWCDVSVDEDRGWVPGEAIQYEYENRWVYVHDYGPRIGVPIVAFALGTYWASHYHHYGWYRDRNLWIHSSHGHRPHGHYSAHYIPEHHYGSGRHLPPSYDHLHHSNPHYAGAYHGGSRGSDRAIHHGAPSYHQPDRHGGSYVNRSDSNDHHGATSGHYAGSGSDHRSGSYVNHSGSNDHHGGAYVNRSEPNDHHGGPSYGQQHGAPQQHMAQQQHGQPQGHGQQQSQQHGREQSGHSGKHEGKDHGKDGGHSP